MTLYHFGNCLALIYAPYHMAYKFSGISEYSSFSKCVYAGALYMFTQLCKMLLLATFFPDSDSGQSSGDVLLEILKATVDFADLVGLYFALNAVPGKGHAKILTAAIGWASAEAVVSRAVSLWVGARGAEFSWRHVTAAAEANVALLGTVSSAALVWLWARSDLPPQHAPLLLTLLLLTPYRGVLEQLAAAAAGGGAGVLLAARALHAALVASAALAMFAALHTNIA